MAGTAFARFEWRDVVQEVVIDRDGSVTVVDERTLWTDEDFGEAFICIGHPPSVRVTLLEGSGAASPGPAARAFQQACESGASGTEVVVRQEARVPERRVRFVYRLEGTLDVYRDVVQWYWNLIQLDHPPILGYRLTVTAPGSMTAPFDAFLHRYDNPERPRVVLSDDRRVLAVALDRIPPGDGVEVRYLMDPSLFAATGSESGLARLLEAEGAFVARSPVGASELHLVAAMGSAEDVRSLVAAGADVLARDGVGFTPLHRAAEQNPDPAVVRALLAAGAKVTARAQGGLTPLHAAAASSSNPDVVFALVDGGADPNARADPGVTPLMVAAGSNRSVGVLEALLVVGADVDATAEDGTSALMLAAGRSLDPEVVRALLRAGADASLRDGFGERAIEHASRNGVVRDSDVFWELNDATY